MRTSLIKTVLFSLPVLAVVGCASAPRLHSYGLDPDNAALVHKTCSEVMGLRAGFQEYDACGDSLAQSVRVLNDSRLTAHASNQCQAQGHAAGSTDLARCVVMSKRQPVAHPTFLASQPASNGLTNASYFSLSRVQQAERVELSCAQLGLHPATTGFNHCVVTMKQAFFEIQNPM